MPASLPDYQQITECTESWFDRLGDSPLGMGWPGIPDARKRYQVMLDVIRPGHSGPVDLLDFGCGAGHLYQYIQENDRTGVRYRGIDLSDRFVRRCLAKYPEADFRCVDVLQTPEQLTSFDYAVVNGVFTSKCRMSFEQMFDFVQLVVNLLYSRCRIGIAFNAMSKQVDWERDDLFHLPLDVLAEFLCRRVSRHFVIRNDYGLYEYTAYVYREPQISSTA